MPDWIMTASVSFLGGGALVAIIGHFSERWKFKAERKAKKEDREEEKSDKTNELRESLAKFEEEEKEQNNLFALQLHDLKEMQEAQSKALMLMLMDRILHLGQSYIAKGEVSFDNRKRLHDMHDCYHKGLGGNGDTDLVMAGVDELPLTKKA